MNIKKINFFSYFVIFLVIFYFLFSGNTFSFSWLWLWTEKQNIKLSENFIRSNIIDDTVIHTALANISTWKWNYHRIHYVSTAVSNTSSTRNLVNMDVVQLLDWRSWKKLILEWYLSQVRLVIAENEYILERLRQDIFEKNQELIFCDNEKSIWDNMFFQWLNSLDYEILITWLNRSASNWPCYIENRIYHNAYDAIFKKLDYYNKILVRKQNLLESNSDLLVNNLDLFKSNYMENLIWFRNELRLFRVN